MSKLKEYAQRYQKLHAGESYQLDGKLVPGTERMFDGSMFARRLLTPINKFVQNRTSFTLLDYGCGKAKHLNTRVLDGRTIYEVFPVPCQTYFCYDPGYLPFEKKPPSEMKFTVVACSDVMEHIPEEYVGDVLSEIYVYLEKDGAAFFSISGNLAHKGFEDGENLHCTVYPFEWWVEKLEKHFPDKKFWMIHDDDNAGIKKYKHWV